VINRFDLLSTRGARRGYSTQAQIDPYYRQKKNIKEEKGRRRDAEEVARGCFYTLVKIRLDGRTPPEIMFIQFVLHLRRTHFCHEHFNHPAFQMMYCLIAFCGGNDSEGILNIFFVRLIS